MQKGIAILKSMLISRLLFAIGRRPDIGVVLMFAIGLFSNSVSAQLTLETFDSGLPATWTVTSNQVVPNNWEVTAATAGYQGTSGVWVRPYLNSTVGTTAEYYLITPQFITPNTTEVRFQTKLGAAVDRGTRFELRLSTAPQPSIGNFVVVQSWTDTNLNVNATSFEEKVVTLPSITPGVPVYLAFVAITNQTGATTTAGNIWYVDNVRVIESCSQVTGITSKMTANSAVINWTHASATNFEIQIVAKGQSPTSGDTNIVNNGGGSFSYTKTGLAENTDYDVYIKTICDATTASAWAGPFSVKTLISGLSCASPTVIPTNISVNSYVLSTNLNKYYDNQTYTPLNSQSLSCQPIGQSMNFLSGDHAFLSYTPTASGLVNVGLAVTPSSTCQNTSVSVFIFDSCTGIGTTANCLGSLVTGTALGNSVQIPNLYLVGGTTYYFVISAPFPHTPTAANAPSICFTFTLSQPSCSIPSGLSYDNLSQTSARFSWDNPQNLVSAWQYIVKSATLPPPANSDTGTPTTQNANNTFSGLTSGTAYNFYVRSVCNGTPGTWSSALSFTTQCAVFSTPYSTDFGPAPASGPATPQPCWTSLDLNKDNRTFTYAYDSSVSPAQGVYASCTGASGNATDDMLVSPQIHFDGVKAKRLMFKFYNYQVLVTNAGLDNGFSTFKVLLSTTGIGPNNFTTELLPVQTYQTGRNWVTKIVVIPASIVGDVNIAWYLPKGTKQTASLRIDDVTIDDMPDCPEPLTPIVTASTISEVSAQFSWVNSYTNINQWQVVAQPLGSGIPVNDTNAVLVNSTNSTTDSNGNILFTMTNLTPSTKYEYYVRSYCDSTHQSQWIGPAKFNTLCDAQPVPYYESFDDTDPISKKFCWSVINKDADATQWIIDATKATIYPNSISAAGFKNYDDYLVSPPVNLNGKLMLKFKYNVSPFMVSGGNTGNFEVLMSPTPDFSQATVLIPSHDFNNADYLEDFVIFNYNGPAYFAFHVPNNLADPQHTGIVSIDDFSIDVVPSCPNPSLLTVSNITLNSAVLGWKKGNVETQWEVVVQKPDSGTPIGSGVAVNTNPTYSLSGLSENTAYEFYIRAVCGSDFSDWIGPVKFNTLCSILPTPFVETFEADSSSKSCWTVVNNNGDLNQWFLSSTVNPIFGSEMASLNCFTNGKSNDWMITPTLAVKPNQRLRFFYKSQYDPGYLEDLKVRLSVNGMAINQFSNILYENGTETTTDATGTVTGSDKITVASTKGIKVGDFIYIPGYPFKYNIDNTPYNPKVVAINGSVITVGPGKDYLGNVTNGAIQTISGPLPVIFYHDVINNLEPKEMIINLSSITSATNVNIAFQVPPGEPDAAGGGRRGSYFHIDNVIVEDIPACPSVYNVTSSANTPPPYTPDTSAVIDWQSAGSETSWEISVQPYGTAAPVGNTDPKYLTTATSHPYTVTGLTPSTRYQYYVRAVCSGTSQSEWIGPFDLLSKCDLTNACDYTIRAYNGNTGQVQQGLQIIQNGVVQETLTFPAVAPNQPLFSEAKISLCSGIEFSLYWIGIGSGLQYSDAHFEVEYPDGTIFTSQKGLGKINSTVFTAVSSCKAVTCQQPTNIAVSNMDVLSWTPGGTETQWEVFVQPLGQGSIPTSGVIVNTPSYTPVDSDFTLSPTAGTNEFFVRAVCGTNDNSYWTGPFVFVRNDEPENAIALQVNTDGACTSQGIKASFINTTASAVPTSCSGVNGGDIWYKFIATSKVQTVELSNFNPGSYDASGGGVNGFPTIVMSLYEVQADNSLIEKECSEDNSLVTTYSAELTVGKTYMIRVKYNGSVPNDKKFDICVSTPADICDMHAFNYSFEKLPATAFTPGNYNFSNVTPGWRTNTDAGLIFTFVGTNSEGFVPYEGGQCIQLIQDPVNAWDPSGPIKGLYKDFMTSTDIKQIDYSFASSTRGQASTVELWAGPPAGPFTMIDHHLATPLVWGFVKGIYNVPQGQTVTRFIFRVYGNALHHLLDAADFKVPSNNILTQDQTLNCKQSTVTVSAEEGETGVGEWSADSANPEPSAVIVSPQNTTTDITGLVTPGNYIFYWTTRYCTKQFKVVVESITAVPTVETPVEYCTADTPVALKATAPAGYTLEWYTVATGGTGSSTAPIPSVDVEGKTTYYVALVDANGCTGSRVPIEVVVKQCSTDIPKGISPDGDGKNDNLDLSTMEVSRLEIFNRYGTEVFSKDNYTNQWHGQSNKGSDLPDGTYFYLVHYMGNKTAKGWIYVNRKH